MDKNLAQTFDRLPRLDTFGGASSVRICKICREPAPFFDMADFNKCCRGDEPYLFGPAGIGIPYYRCVHCAFTFTDFFDDWSTTDFSKYIYNEDYIKVDPEYAAVRPLRSANRFAQLMNGLEHVHILDYGSGNGAFADRLKAQGFSHVENYDPFSSPDRPSGRFDVIACSEVIEHVSDPCALLTDIKSLLSPDGCFAFTQTLQPHDFVTRRGSWWYMAPRNGHISLYAASTLSILGAAFGLTFYRGLEGRHAFAAEPASDLASAILHRLGRRLSFVKLNAPEALTTSGESSAWQGVVTKGLTRFRWTRAARIEWPVPKLSPGTTFQIEVPFVNPIDASQAGRIKIKYGAHSVLLRVAGPNLAGEVVVDEGAPDMIALLLPPAEPTVGQGAEPMRLAVRLRSSPPRTSH